jgi:hypothetical protein
MNTRKLNTGVKNRTKLGLTLEQSAREILAHLKGEAKLATRRIVLPDSGCVSIRFSRHRRGRL